MRTRSLLVVAACTGICAELPAQTTYSNQAAFLAAVAAPTTLGFEGIAPPGGTTLITNVGGVTFSGTPNLFVIDPGYFAGYNHGTGAVFSPQAPPPVVVTLTFPTPVTAFGTDFGSFDFAGSGGAGSTFTFALSNGFSATRTQTVESPSFDYFGVTSPTPFTSITLTSDALATIYDDVTFGALAPTSAPEPVAAGLVAAGLLALGGVARRRRREGGTR